MAQTSATTKMPHAVFNPQNANLTVIDKYENHAEIRQADEVRKAAAAREARIRAIENSEPEQKRAGGGGEVESQSESKSPAWDGGDRGFWFRPRTEIPAIESAVDASFERRECAWDGEGGFWCPPSVVPQIKESDVDVNYERRDGAWDGEGGFWKN